MQAAFEVAEENGDGLDAFFVGEVFDALFLNLVRRDALHALVLGLEVQLFEFLIGERQKITQFSRHDSPRMTEVVAKRK